MVKIFLQCLTISILLLGTQEEDMPPDVFTDIWGEEQYISLMLINMTKWFAIDATIKLRHADRVQANYRHMIAFHLGSIMAGIQDTFKQMLRTYRTFSNITDFRRGKYPVEDVFNAYEIVKGLFNQIRYEKDLFYSVVDYYEQQNSRKGRIKDKLQDAIEKFQQANGRRSGPGLPTLWRGKWYPGGNGFTQGKGYAEGKGKGLTKGPQKSKEEDYKRSLRMRAWKERWQKYIPEVEGVDINIPDIDPQSGKPKEGSI